MAGACSDAWFEFRFRRSEREMVRHLAEFGCPPDVNDNGRCMSADDMGSEEQTVRPLRKRDVRLQHTDRFFSRIGFPR